MYTIKKAFDFCYSHRVWRQELDQQLSDNGDCSCRHIHGHNAIVEIEIKVQDINEGKSMVLDFKELQFFKKWLDSMFDHMLILDKSDPLTKRLFSGVEQKDLELGLSQLTSQGYRDSLDEEFLSGVIFTPFCPTSENFAKFFYELVIEKLRTYFSIRDQKFEIIIHFHETPKCVATYTESVF